jgi:transglutaminase-like putative cysteine protease
MSWRIRIEHSTGYRYAAPVTSSYNEARLIPQTSPRQTTLEAIVRTEPVASTYRYWDYWGTQVTAFDMHTPHTEMVVTGRSVVQTGEAPSPSDDAPGWDDLRSDALADRYVEFIRPSASAPGHAELTEVARELAARHEPEAFVRAAGDWVREQLTYRPGTTGVQTSAVEAFEARAGVCQDFAHVALVMMRAVGMPARYVSGYLHPAPNAEVGETVAGESHAWVEGWVGQWYGYDPTNSVPAGEPHVVVARGRDYNDVPPMRGVFSGGAATSLGVTVGITRLS